MKRTTKWFAVLAVVTLMVTGLAVGAFGASAKTTCPGMPKGATNYFDAAKMTATEADPFVVEGGSLCLAPRKLGSQTSGNVIAYLDVPKELTSAKNGFVISFWTKSNSREKDGFYSVRFAENNGEFYELHFDSLEASVIDGNMWEYDKMFVPSTGYCLDEKVQDNYSGHWKKVEMLVKDGGNKLTVFIDGEAMQTADKTETMTFDGAINGTTRIGFGDRSKGFIMSGLRIYKVDTAAKEFEPDINPTAAIDAAEDGTPGSEGGTGLPKDAKLKSDEKADDGEKGDDKKDDGKKDDTADKDGVPVYVWIIVGAVVLAAAAVTVVIVLKKKKAAPVGGEAKAEGTDDESKA